MIKVSVFYPNKEGARFDMDYYLQKHIPMVRQKMAGAMKGMGVEQGIAGGMPGAPLTYRVIAHMTFDSVEAYQAAFSAHAPSILADVPNYTDLQPVVQISEVKM
ncbi:MAG TPA: EthD family reductase [Candidatus Acidoferrum sp.]|nr:EthD family reductase [Candidatus Acidoferrum sp.]